MKHAQRILHFSNSASSLGNGIVNVAVDLAIDQATRGATAFVSAGGGWNDLMSRHGVKVYTLPLHSSRVLPKALFRLWRILREFKPDIIHAHMRKSLFMVWPMARLLRIPIVLHLHNIHNEHMGTTGLADRVIAVSNAVAEDLKSHGTKADRIRIVMNGTLGTQRLSQEPVPLPLGKPAIVSVAGITVRKGMYELIEAFSKVAERYPTAHLYLVGGGSAEEVGIWEAAAATACADRIHFEKFQADPRSYLVSAEVFVLASRREAFGLALIEARAAGCAIVATDVDGIPEIIQHNATGLLVPPEDAGALAASITSLLDDAELRTRLQRETVQDLQRYEVQRMSVETELVYDELLNAR
ncbi:glycosyltransferase [Terriglobus roseus DSM 18391]|uniref:Glycosyltransferase n=1 Tax=Terriglobus roseus (strain DSM 18391 / NRRL B-41598 / KBS 63) TaxID=926566 RepID=I3ZFL0_TERRK|nr:glycosyltransferase [Terriglobus roseus]AFL88028.1 glycosyltransferase [Terriglobus roseus DSM 18391]